MKIIAFQAGHLYELKLQDAQQYFGDEILKPYYGEMIARSGDAFTVKDGEEVIMCCGCHELWNGRAEMWALVSKSAGRHMASIHKAVKGYLLQARWKRIEATVDAGFDAGMRWLKMLGFENETPIPMKGYRPNGGDSYLFARVKP
jgi:hypothetical protein